VKERKGAEVEADIRREFIPAWGVRPITELSDLDVLVVINAKKFTAPAQARNLLATAKRLFGWTVDQRTYGLAQSPAADLKPTKIIGKKKRRQRTLNDDELFALWRAAKRLPYPAGPVYQTLTLTALRLNEAADASRGEFSPELMRILRAGGHDTPDRLKHLSAEHKVWVIPAERMKGNNDEPRAHAVPLTNDMLAILVTLPVFKKGQCLFSTTFGASPVWVSDKIKKRIDARMLRTLRALARRRGDDPSQVKLAPWVNHDIRRTVRSHLSRLRVTEEAREAVLAHARPGVKGTYDLYDYFDEKREALELWSAQLKRIVSRPPATS
jgi:integrase